MASPLSVTAGCGIAGGPSSYRCLRRQWPRNGSESALRGAAGICTRVDGFAGRCLTTRPPRPADRKPTGSCLCACPVPKPGTR